VGLLKTAAAGTYGVAGWGSAKGIAGGAFQLGGAAAVGVTAGTLAYNYLIQGTRFDNWLGSVIAHALAAVGSQEAKDAIATNRDFARRGVARGTIVHTQINLDGHEIAKVVTKHQAKEAHAPETGISGFDERMGLIPPGVGLRW